MKWGLFCFIVIFMSSCAHRTTITYVSSFQLNEDRSLSLMTDLGGSTWSNVWETNLEDTSYSSLIPDAIAKNRTLVLCYDSSSCPNVYQVYRKKLRFLMDKNALQPIVKNENHCIMVLNKSEYIVIEGMQYDMYKVSLGNVSKELVMNEKH